MGDTDTIVLSHHVMIEGLPPTVTKRIARLWIAIICTVTIVWCSAAVLSGNAQIAGNALQHIFWSIYFRWFAPGVVAVTRLILPLCICILYQAVWQWGVSPWYAVALLVLIAYVLVNTIREGREASPVIGAIYGLGDRTWQCNFPLV